MASATSSLVARPPIHAASFEKWNPERRDEIFLYYESEADRENYRYKLTVLDQPSTVATQSEACKTNTPFVYATAVFFIPAGRESEYTFQSLTGLRAIAESAGTARLIAVTFGRHHSFPSQIDVQTELTYVIQRLTAAHPLPELPHSVTGRTNGAATNTASIPFMALDGIGQRNVLASGTSVVSGRYLVEQCAVTGSDQQQPQYVRRLYFLDGNPFVIQTEVALKARRPSDNCDVQYIVDKSVTAFEYHKCLTAGIMALLPGPNASCLLLGLGGGGLVNLWHHLHTTWNVTAVELDPSMPEIAQTYFDLECDRLSIRIGDGLHVHCASAPDSHVVGETGEDNHSESEIASQRRHELSTELGFAAASLDCIVIDVDSKDSGSGMSCPPASFVTIEYLERVRRLLRPDTGVLAINVSARDAASFVATCTTVQTVFTTVFLSKRPRHTMSETDADSNDNDDDLNVVVFATQRPSLPSHKEMSDHLTLRIQESVGLIELDEILVSDLCMCIEDFVPWDETDSSKAPNKKKSSGNKRRNNKRGGSKRR